MRKFRAITWGRVKVYFGVLVIGVFALGMVLIYASSLSDPQRGRSLTGLRTIGFELMGLAVVSVVLARWLNRRLGGDDHDC
jgi:cell division protein FtsW (lipid II flippase)